MLLINIVFFLDGDIYKFSFNQTEIGLQQRDKTTKAETVIYPPEGDVLHS